ncbi:hypothetical protein CcrC1_gp128 [Caulobacter phage C1]|nr:hypothetical protein CcrC1_gp128 [Caulobacter phage C1]UTU08357.1 hypothetical protein CcrC2_gp129 [Caulobacter phage C2]UTU08874.1 hypothetical protein CcrJ4_gp123 [Caulobacter phage J4]UTU09430.1 hypothetical protein CcrBL47_gp144 [Caulobacter phage BL47]UTU09990.1 hypothetical protein CcrRB23_gp128 [Caulobacter phage RB23]WGN97015.1 hypothetical protein [Bertelyvirus sp.]
MAIQNLHSFTTGTIPNLLPGMLAINIPDDVFWIRKDGRRTPVKLTEVRERAVPATGLPGAPLVREGGKAVWDNAQAPSSVVNGVIRVDLPPAPGVFAIPGAQINGFAADKTLGVNAVEIAPFYVRSDSVTITHLSVGIKSAAPGPVRIGICDSLGIIITDQLISSPVQGANVVALGAPRLLPRGTYRTILWCSAITTFGVANAVQPEQGWSLNNPSLLFTRAYQGIKDMSAGIGSLPALSSRNTSEPGQDKMVMLRWTVP